MEANLKKRYWTVDRIMQLIIGVVLATGVVLLLRYLSGVLLPFVVACFISYLLQPVVDFNRRLTHARGRALPSVLTLVDASVVVALVIYIFLPSIVRDLDMLGGILRSVSEGSKPMPRFVLVAVDFIERYFDPDNLVSLLDGSQITDLLSKGSSLLEESLDIVTGLVSVLLTLIYIVFILIDYPQICHGLKLIFPAKYRSRAMAVVHDVEHSMNSYFRGQGLVALCAMAFYCIGFSFVGLPLAVPMGLLVGILYMIPYFQYITLVPVAVICFIYTLGGTEAFMPLMGKCILVYALSQSVCDYVITPHVMKREMGLNPAVILLSLSVWGTLLGIIGMIIALPATALIMAYYKKYISNPPSSGAKR